jgi:Cu2+-exporting ATPase
MPPMLTPSSPLSLRLGSSETEDGSSLVALGDEGGWLALFHLRDSLRDDAAALVASLRERGIGVSLYSGDRGPTVAHWAARLGIDDWRGDMSPASKREAIVRLQREGATVVMVGDGANDSPALAQADASMALATGAAIAHSGADVVLVGRTLAPVREALDAARRSARVVRQNLAWAASYNAVCIPLAMAGWLNPWLAGLGMSLSSLLVVGNALRLARNRKP